MSAKTIMTKKEMEDVDVNVNYNQATIEMGPLFAKYKKYLTDSTNHIQNF